MNNIGEKLKEYFKEQGTTHKEVAEKLNVSTQYVNSILNGKKNIGGNTAKKLAETYNMNLNWLLTGEGEMLKPRPPEGLEGLDERYTGRAVYEQAALAYREKIRSGEIIPIEVVKEFIQSKNELIEQLRKEIKRLEDRIAELESHSLQK